MQASCPLAQERPQAREDRLWAELGLTKASADLTTCWGNGSPWEGPTPYLPAELPLPSSPTFTPPLRRLLPPEPQP